MAHPLRKRLGENVASTNQSQHGHINHCFKAEDNCETPSEPMSIFRFLNFSPRARKRDETSRVVCVKALWQQESGIACRPIAMDDCETHIQALIDCAGADHCRDRVEREMVWCAISRACPKQANDLKLCFGSKKSFTMKESPTFKCRMTYRSLDKCLTKATDVIENESK